MKIPKCPNCGSDTAPNFIEVNVLEEQYRSTYEELYHCCCGCRFVALVPRAIDENVIVHKIIREGNFEKYVDLSVIRVKQV